VFSPLDRIDPYGIKSDARPLLVYTLQDLKDYGRMGSESILWADVDRNGGDG